MRINGLIRRLETIKRKMGNVTVLVDTEAAEYTVHCVDVTGVSSISKEHVGEDLATLRLDDNVKVYHRREPQYVVLIVREAAGGYYVTCPQFKGIRAHGKTVKGAISKAGKAILDYMESVEKKGKRKAVKKKPYPKKCPMSKECDVIPGCTSGCPANRNYDCNGDG